MRSCRDDYQSNQPTQPKTQKTLLFDVMPLPLYNYSYFFVIYDTILVLYPYEFCVLHMYEVSGTTAVLPQIKAVSVQEVGSPVFA